MVVKFIGKNVYLELELTVPIITYFIYIIFF